MSSDASTLVRRYFGAYQTKDRHIVEEMLPEDFTFTSPYDDHIDRASYFERCWPNSELVREIRIEKLFEKDGEVLIRYELETHRRETFRNVEFLRTDGRLIREVEVYFGSLPKVDPTK